MTKTVFLAASLATLLVLPVTALAQPCGGTPNASAAPTAFNVNPTVCVFSTVTATSLVGDANLCGGSASFLRAMWPSAAARTMDPTGGCIFFCPSGSCKVGNDGLPVELKSFGVE